MFYSPIQKNVTTKNTHCSHNYYLCIINNKNDRQMEKKKQPEAPAKKQIADLLNESQVLEFAKLDSLKSFLNMDAPEKWVKEHPYIKGHKYLPIDKVEWFLDRIFKRYRIEVLKTGMLMNTVECTVRLHYWNPVTNEWDFHDGVGAAEVQTEKGTGCLKMDMSNVNRGAITMALPIAKTYAIKDAADHIGRIFGRDLNRKDVISFSQDSGLQDKAARIEALMNDENDNNDESTD